MNKENVEIQTTSQSTLQQLRRAMQNAFSDYSIPLQLEPDAFEMMMTQRGLDRAASRVALIDGQIVAIWLVSVRAGQSYLISSGTIPVFPIPRHITGTGE